MVVDCRDSRGDCAEETRRPKLAAGHPSGSTRKEARDGERRGHGTRGQKTSTSGVVRAACESPDVYKCTYIYSIYHYNISRNCASQLVQMLRSII